jgi:L-cysteine/cystine lyase
MNHRSQFPALTNKAYFNYGGQGPLPQVAIKAIQETYEYIQQAGPFSQEVNNWATEEANRTREAMASELGTTPATIALTEDVTIGCNIALWGIDWQAGDRLLMSDCEHQGIIATVQELQRRFGIEVDVCPLMATLNAGDPVAVVTQYLQPRTRLLVISHVFWNTGQVLPLAEIVAACRQANTAQTVRILVDAAQSVGLLPVNLSELGADFYAFTGHKWWCGPEGVGGLYVSPEVLAELHPTFIGWRSILVNKSNQPVGWQPDASRYEVSTSARPLYPGLRAAIALHQQWGTSEQRYQRLLDLSKYLWQSLTAIPAVSCLRSSPPESSLISFQIDGGSHLKLVQFLETQGYFLRIMLDPNCVRACVHYFTLEDEIDRLVVTIKKFFERSSE